MKKIIFSAACLAMALASCNQIETPENENQTTRLGINVTTAVETKGLVTDKYLPDGSSVGVFVTDKSGVTYDGQTFANVKYTGAGTGTSQTWSSETSIMLSYNQAVLASYYPYSEDVTDVKAIPVKATSDIQTDWMWAQPVTGLYNKNTNAQISMSHALAAVRLNVKRGNYEGSVEVTSVGFSSDGAATEALLDATNGTLSSITGQGSQFVAYETFTTSNTAEQFEFMTIPTGVSAPMVVELTVNGSKLTALGEAALLEPGYIYEYTVSVDGSTGVSVVGFTVSQWQSVNKGSVAFYEELEYDFDGTVPDPFVEWAAIQHKDGSLYSVSKWEAYETAGLVTDADANGVVVLYSRYAVCPHVIYPVRAGGGKHYSSTGTVPGVTTTTNIAEARLDVNGKANTEAILAAVANGTIADATAAQYCVGITFANGQQGYLPAAGELQAWNDNYNKIMDCLNAISSSSAMLPFNTKLWSSTSYNEYRAWQIKAPGELYDAVKKDPNYPTSGNGFVCPVTEFTPPM